MQSKILPCGFKAIPIIVNGQYNLNLGNNDLANGKYALFKLQAASINDRLYKNYSDNLHLHRMMIYSVLWDEDECAPVLTTGAQRTSKNSCRLFSRYFLFPEYRSKRGASLYDKIDNFETDMFHLAAIKTSVPFIFWSRDRGSNFFYKIKQARPDLFNNWSVYHKEVELIWHNNFQGIFYTNTSDPDMYISELLFHK